jgi:uncharacterized protein YbjT (DUF2867 family)
MKITVIGGSGQIGSRLVALLKSQSHEVVAASLETGVNTITREGLAEAVLDSDVVVDVSNSPSFEPSEALTFFQTSARNLMAAENAAGTRHHVLLSIVGADRNEDSGYLRAKVAQENVVKQSGIPYTIVRSTQFFEFMKVIGDYAVQDGKIVVSSAPVQPIAVADVVDQLAKVATSAPSLDTVQIAGPERHSLAYFVKRRMEAAGDSKEVVGDPNAKYDGAVLNDTSLVPTTPATIGKTGFDAWLAAS